MQEALLYEKLPESRVQCHICQWHCKINVDRCGVCGIYRNIDGRLYSSNYGLVSSIAADPIEKKPLFHFHPATSVFSMGTLGCNFHCRHCQNWEISRADIETGKSSCHEVSPEMAIDLAERYDCRGIAWTYNEPGIWLEYVHDTARLAREKGLYTVFVTNGYLSPEALDTIGPYIDAYRVDIKGFSDRFYREIPGVPAWRDILEVTKLAKTKWNMHIEVITNIIPTYNDDDEQLEGIAGWISGELGNLTPWHVTRFHPAYKLTDIPATPLPTLERACETGERAGLKFIYTGNAPGHKSESTVCYSCGNVAVERYGYQTRITGLDGSRCSNCGADLNFRV
ncbi:MAG: AmmeMemoRadiSam system radical SAM enzyme [Dehalococcoidales bacterium]|nr:AmmeMemoRadiSam system radical SAM enzyme [Dehalococcoidales bacterium]